MLGSITAFEEDLQMMMGGIFGISVALHNRSSKLSNKSSDMVARTSMSTGRPCSKAQVKLATASGVGAVKEVDRDIGKGRSVRYAGDSVGRVVPSKRKGITTETIRSFEIPDFNLSHRKYYHSQAKQQKPTGRPCSPDHHQKWPRQPRQCDRSKPRQPLSSIEIGHHPR